MAYKVFSNGDALTGGELNTFLMNQSVITFASVAARNAALPSPLEGQLVWLEDSNKYVYYSGAAWIDLIMPVPSGNAIINGGFDIWQRGTSLSAADTFRFLADRWGMGTVTSTIAPSRQTFTPGTAPAAGYEAEFFHRAVVASANTSGSLAYLYNKVEDVRSFAGQTVTLSFFAKADAGKTVAIETVQDFGSGGSTFTTAATKIAITSSWARYTYTFTFPSIAGKTIGAANHLGIYFWYDAGSSWNSRTASLGNQSGTFDMWGVQLEAGSSATPFKRNATSIQGELAACQRYFLRTNPGSSAPQGVGMFYASTTFIVHQFLKQSMRTAPTLTVNNAANFTVFSNGSARGVTSIAADVANTDVFSLAVTTSSSGTSGHAGALNASNINATFDFSAEL